MKRTKSINLSRLRKKNNLLKLKPVSAAVIAATLASCGSDREGYLYTSLEDCFEKNPNNIKMCQTNYQKAKDIARKKGPVYATQRSCEYHYGEEGCEGSGSYYHPTPSGFISSSNYGGAPVFSTIDTSDYRAVDGTSYGNKPGKVTIQQRTISRGGFGSRAAAKSSWGGSSSRGGWGG